MKILDREIGPAFPPYFIAEIGANHDGDYERALRLIELAADAGADAVKFQHFEAATIVSRRGFAELGKMAHQASWEEDVYDVYEKASVPRDWTEHLSAYAHDHGIAFITTPYSLELADYVEPYVDAYKIGSGDVTYYELIQHVVAKRKPVLLATGASTRDEVIRALFAMGEQARRERLVLMQCNTNYTGESENSNHSNLRVLTDWARTYGCVTGLSDHTDGDLTVCAAVALGASVVEKHLTDDKTRRGPDHNFAMDPYEWCVMMDDGKRAYESLGDGNKSVEGNEDEARIVQRRALRWNHRLFVGQTVKPGLVIATRPCPRGALEPYRLDEIVGRQLKRNVEFDELVRMEDVT